LSTSLARDCDVRTLLREAIEVRSAPIGRMRDGAFALERTLRGVAQLVAVVKNANVAQGLGAAPALDRLAPAP
jgi:hypothetical protein